MDRRCWAFVDVESVRHALGDGGVGGLARAVTALVRAHGRLLSAAFYGSLSEAEAGEVRFSGGEPRVAVEDGEGSAPESIQLAVDAGELLAHAFPPDFVLLVTDDAQLAELVRRWRRRGATVLSVVPSALMEEAPARTSDRAASVEELLAGVLAPDPSWGEPRRREAREVRPRHAGGAGEEGEADVTRLVVLLRDLEARMPFVGMRWFKNKVLGPHNVGLSGMAEKQALLNRAVDEGLLETYRVGNRDEQGEPVTACRLAREHPRVREIITAHPVPDCASAPAEYA